MNKFMRTVAACSLVFSLFMSQTAFVRAEEAEAAAATEEKTAENGAEGFVKGTRNTFYVFPWLPNDTLYLENVNPMYHDTYGEAGLYGHRVVYNTNLAVEEARKLKAHMEKMPEGRRAFCFQDYVYYTINTDENRATGYWQDAAHDIANHLDQILTIYKRMGGPDLDLIVSDQERYTFPWYVGAEGLEKEEAFDRLVNDPRYLTEIRPELERLGFEFCYEEGRNELANAIDNMYIHGGSTPAEEHHPGGIADNFLKLHGAMAGMDAAVLYESCYEVAKKHYPDIYYGNYQSYVMPEETEPGLSPQGYIYGYTRGLKAGNFSNQETYGWNYLAALNLKNFVPDYPYPYYHNTTYNSMLGDFRLFQRSSMYTQNNQEVAWLCNYSYLWNERTIGRTAYWDEFVFHTFMSSSLPFACYYPESVKTAQEDYYTSETLYELDELCGFEERTPLFEETVPFDSKYILSGMNCGGRNVWRITPDLCYEDFTIEDFLYDEENLIFKIGNQFVDFPEGSFIYTPEYKPEHKERSYFGYWVITPEGTRPTEYRDESLPIMPEPDILIDAAQTHLTKLQKKQANSVAMAKANNEY